MVKARKYVYKTIYKGEPKRTDLEIVEEELPPIGKGEFLAKALYISVDPYQRAYANYLPAGSDAIGYQVAEVIESKDAAYPVGSLVYGSFGWRTHTLVNVEKQKKATGLSMMYPLPDFKGLSPSLGLGALGMPGNTAYFGLLEVCKPQKGETVVVSGAAGAVGSLVGQIAKIKGCKVIGFAGSEEKCKWLVNELGFDHAFNYKTVNAEEALKKAAPDGVDCYFDNVGGDLLNVVIKQMNKFGRVGICGIISIYNAVGEIPKLPNFLPIVLNKELKIEGLYITRWNDRWLEGITQTLKWIKEGKLKVREHVTEGFDNIYDAFVGMLRGENFGKAVVKL